MRNTNKRGYVTLEAAMLLPVFLIAVLALGCFIKVYDTAENVSHAILDETGYTASRAYGIKTVPFFSGELKKRIQQENHSVRDVQIKSFRYLYQEGNKRGMIQVACQYRVKIALPFSFSDEKVLKTRVKCRGFIGKREEENPMAFDEMEREGDWNPVWIFPDSGKKFHSENCSYVKENAKQMVLTGDLKIQYQPCRLCRPGDLPVGSWVYCFIDTGKVYHRAECRQVEKYTIEIDKEDALGRGYTPCSKCGGG